MPKDTQSYSASKAPAAGPSTLPGGKKPPSLAKRDAEGIPGVSKLKASIRQTQRLLAKDTLEPGLRLQTQRRLHSLQTDLQRAQSRDVEKKNGAKYHQVKFFERQKLGRLIRRFSKAAALPGAGSSEAQQELERARIMFHYVLHFPNAERYIALFPSAPKSDSSTESDNLKLPAHLSDSHPPLATLPESAKSERRRLEILLNIQDLVKAGELSGEPETTHDQRISREVRAAISASRSSAAPAPATSGSSHDTDYPEGAAKGKNAKKGDEQGAELAADVPAKPKEKKQKRTSTGLDDKDDSEAKKDKKKEKKAKKAEADKEQRETMPTHDAKADDNDEDDFFESD